jgi:hypothetical protein
LIYEIPIILIGLTNKTISAYTDIGYTAELKTWKIKKIENENKKNNG